MMITTLITLLFSAGNLVYAQEEAAVCSCSPTSFTFRLDFNRICDDNTVLIGKTHGIDRSFCRTDGVMGGNDTQSPPTVVELSSILILELDSSLQVIKQHFRDGLGLVDGQTMSYESISATSTDGDTVAAIQMALIGVTADGTEIQSQFILTYTNLSSTEVFRAGDVISWLVVVSHYGTDAFWRSILCSRVILTMFFFSSSSRTILCLLQTISANLELFLTWLHLVRVPTTCHQN